MKISQTLYRTKEWKDLRAQAIEHAGDACECCGYLQNDGAVLQLHHDLYLRGRKPWEYSFSELTVLCKRCHAEIHEKIMSTSNWNYEGETDLGGLDGICDFCGTEIRFEHHLGHPTWGSLKVGTNCADFLTETQEATDKRKYIERKNRFLNPSNWKSPSSGIFEKKRKNLSIRLLAEHGGNFIEVNGKHGSKSFASFDDAKIYLFDKIENGAISKYFETKR